MTKETLNKLNIFGISTLKNTDKYEKFQSDDFNIDNFRINHNNEEIKLSGFLKDSTQKDIKLKFKDVDLAKIIPEIEIIYDETDIKETDILFCDAESFNVFTKQNVFPTEYLYLFLDKISEFSEYKSYNPKFFVKPYSFARILRDILKELFLINGNKKK